MAMFLKHRNALAWVLLLLASFFWVFGQEILSGLGPQGDYETTVVATEQNSGPWDPTTQTTSPTTETWEQPTQEPVPNRPLLSGTGSDSCRRFPASSKDPLVGA